MTLVLSYARGAYALQVSDRLVTDVASHEALDPNANKAIVFLASNALVSIAFAGRAVMHFRQGERERATDHWLVEQLIGQEVGQALNGGLRPYRYDLGYGLKTLCESLDASAACHSQPVDVAFCGFQWNKRKRWQHVWGEIKRHDDSRYHVGARVHRVREGVVHALTVIPGGVSLDQQALLRRLQDADVDVAEAMLVDRLRNASAEADPKVIGGDCMSVVMDGGPVRIRYHASQATNGHASPPGTPMPWIVTPGMVAAPFRAHSSELTIGGLELQIDVLGDGVTVTEPRPGRKRFLIPLITMEPRVWGPEQPDIGPPPLEKDETPSMAAIPTRPVGRNKPCPCGSGKKYKKCHGA